MKLVVFNSVISPQGAVAVLRFASASLPTPPPDWTPSRTAPPPSTERSSFRERTTSTNTPTSAASTRCPTTPRASRHRLPGSSTARRRRRRPTEEGPFPAAAAAAVNRITDRCLGRWWSDPEGIRTSVAASTARSSRVRTTRTSRRLRTKCIGTIPPVAEASAQPLGGGVVGGRAAYSGVASVVGFAQNCLEIYSGIVTVGTLRVTHTHTQRHTNRHTCTCARFKFNVLRMTAMYLLYCVTFRVANCDIFQQRTPGAETASCHPVRRKMVLTSF